MGRVLVMHSDADVTNQICEVLAQAGFEKEVCQSSREIISKLDELSPDVVIHGVETESDFKDVSKLRDRMLAPIIATGRYPSTEGWVKAVDVGADAYLKEPLNPEELVARLKTLVRRFHQRVITAGELTLDLGHGKAHWGGFPLDLSPTELALLSFLVQNQGRVVSREEIIRRVWGCEYNDISPRIVDVYIARLRKKVKDNPSHPHYLVAIRRGGYMFRARRSYPTFGS